MVSRIQKIIKYKKLSASGFADQIGVPRSTISHILSGRNNPSLDLIQKILDTFSDIRTEWLVRGEGHMISAQNTLFSDNDFDSPESIESQGIVQKAKLMSAAPDNQDDHPQNETTIPSSTAHISASPARRSSEIVSEAEKKRSENKKTHSDSKLIVLFSDGTFREYLPANDAV